MEIKSFEYEYSEKLYSSTPSLSYRSLVWKNGMEYGKKFSTGMEGKIFSRPMEWKKFGSMEYRKIIFHSIACPANQNKFSVSFPPEL